MRLRAIGSVVGAAAAALLGTHEAHAQGLRISVSGVAGYASSALIVQGITEEASGIWYGARVGVQLGPVVAEASGLKGTIEPAEGAAGFKRDGGEMRGVLRVSLASWFGLEAGYTVRAFDSPAGYQKWTIPDLGARVSAQLGAEGFRGYVRASYLPSAAVTGLASSSLGLAVEAGVRLEPPRSWLSLGGFYRLERFDFGGSPASRLEQFDFLGVSIGVRLGRR